MQILNWLEKRQIDEELAFRLGVEQIEKSGKAWVKIPYVAHGKVVNHKYRCLDEKAFFQDADGQKVFYNQDILFDETLNDYPLIITEGEVDAWTAIQCGFSKVISVPDGAPNEKLEGDSVKYSYLDGMIEQIRKSPEVILAVDNDKNGANLLHDLSVMIGRDICKWIKYPKDCKDLNDALMKYGQKGVVKSIETKDWLSKDGVYTAETLPPFPEATVYETGMGDFNSKYKIRLGDFTVVTGIPSHGKTTFLNDLLCRTVKKNNLNVCFASLEQHPANDHVRFLRKWYKGEYPMTNQYQADEWINKHFSFIYPSDEQQMSDTLDLEWFLEKAAMAVKRYKANIVVLDPWNELEHLTGRNQTITEYVGQAIRTIKRFAKMFNVHVIVVAHPTKIAKDKDGNLPMPDLYKISDSAHWKNKADIGFVVHRDDEGTIVRMDKVRYQGLIGDYGDTRFHFNQETNHFEERL